MMPSPDSLLQVLDYVRQRWLLARLLSHLKRGELPADVEIARLTGWWKRITETPVSHELMTALRSDDAELIERRWLDVFDALRSDFDFRHALALLYLEWAEEEKAGANWETALEFWKESLTHWVFLWASPEYWETVRRGRMIEEARWKAFQRDFPSRLLLRPLAEMEQCLLRGLVDEAQRHYRRHQVARAACEGLEGETERSYAVALDNAVDNFVSGILSVAAEKLEVNASESGLRRNYDSAISVVEPAMKAMPDNLRLLMFAVERFNDWSYDEYVNERLTLYQGVLRRASPYIDSLLALVTVGFAEKPENQIVATALLRQGFALPEREAINRYRRALEYQPDYENALVLLFDTLIEHAKRIMESEPLVASDSLDEAFKLWSERDSLRAESENLSSLSDALLECGMTLLSHQLFDRAVIRLEEFCTLRPDHMTAQATLAFAKRRLKVERTRRSLLEARESLEDGDPEEALRRLQEASETETDYGEWLQLWERILLALGKRLIDQERSKTAYEMLTEHGPPYPSDATRRSQWERWRRTMTLLLWNYLSENVESALASGDFDRSEALLWEIPKDSEWASSAHRLLAVVEKRKGLQCLNLDQWEEARRLLELALKLNPADTSIRTAINLIDRYDVDRRGCPV